MKQTRVVILEDNLNTAEHLKSLIIELFIKCEVKIVPNLSKATLWLKKNDPEIAIVDIGLPDGSGLDFLTEVKKKNTTAKTIIVTSFADDESVFKALALGADGYILKDADTTESLRILSKIKNNEPPLSPSIAHKILKHFRNETPGDSNLSPREKETLCLIATGYTVPEAAKKLGLSPQTVAGYVKKIYEKLHVSNRAEATQKAIRLKYI